MCKLQRGALIFILFFTLFTTSTATTSSAFGVRTSPILTFEMSGCTTTVACNASFFVGDIVTFSGSLTAADGRPLSGAIVKIVNLSPKPELITVASGVTGIDGEFQLQWIAQLSQGKVVGDATKQFLAETVVFFAQFDGNEEFSPARSAKQVATIRANQLFTFINSDKRVYNPGESALIFINFVDAKNQFIDPDAVRVTFDNSEVKVEKKKIGSYVLMVPALSFQHHQVIVIPGREGYNVGTGFLTIQVGSVAQRPALVITSPLESLSHNFVSLVVDVYELQQDLNIRNIRIVDRVSEINREKVIDDIIENTLFLNPDPLNPQFVGLSDLSPSKDLINEYKNQLSAAQGWPSSDLVIWDSAISEDDLIAELNWSISDSTDTYRSLAVLDKFGKVKFEPIMYFTPTEVTVTGSKYTLFVKNIFGWKIVKAKLDVDIKSADKCKLATEPEIILEISAGLLYKYAKNDKIKVFEFGKCLEDGRKNVECVQAIAVVAWAAKLFSFKIDVQAFNFELADDVPIGSGYKTLIRTKCPDRGYID